MDSLPRHRHVPAARPPARTEEPALMRVSYLMVVVVLATSTACAADARVDDVAVTPPSSAAAGIDEVALRRHTEALASDAYEGRAPGTGGEDSTVGYIAREFARIGLIPGNGDT